MKLIKLIKGPGKVVGFEKGTHLIILPPCQPIIHDDSELIRRSLALLVGIRNGEQSFAE